MRRLFVSVLALVVASCSDERGAPTAPSEPVAERLALSAVPLDPAAVEPALDPALPAELRNLLEAGLTPSMPVQLGAESRVAQGVRPGRRAACRGIAPADGARIALAFGAVDPGGAAGVELELAILLRCNSRRPAEHRFQLPRRVRWSDESFDLGLRRGEPFELVFQLTASGPSSAVLALAPPVLYQPLEEPPTIVLITSDTHRGDHLEGADLAAEIRTPALRALASRGIFFADCYSSSNITVPSHVALLTGLNPLEGGITDNRTRMSDAPETLPEVFQAAGYRTLAVTSLNLLSPGHSNVGQGFDLISWTPATRTADKTVELALRALATTPDRPVFLWVHLFDAHGPYQPPEPFAKLFYPSGKDPSDPALEPESGARIPSYLEGVRDADYIRALYRGEIAFLDSQLARLFAHPRLQAGVVAVTGDHGEVLGNHGIWWAHKDVYPDTLHVPLILAWPGAPAGLHSRTPVTNVDLGRTLLDLAGLAQRPFPGRDLVARTKSAEPAIAADEPRFALGGGRWEAAINRGGWHLILQLAEHEDDERHAYRELHQIELYDLSRDPGCEHDLAAEHPDQAKTLRAELVQWLLGWRGERFAGRKLDDPATLRELAQLGYASDTAGSDSSAPLIDPRCPCSWCARFR